MLRQALLVADELIVPFAPSLMDVRELGRVLQLVEELQSVHEVRPHLLLTKVRANTSSARDARQGLLGQGLPLLDAQISLREAYAHVWGRTIDDLREYEPVLHELMGSKV